jgi:hypothetical protein
VGTLIWPPENGELILEATVPGDQVPAGSKRGTAVRFKDKRGKWKVKTWRDKEGHEHAEVNVSDVNATKLKNRAKEVEAAIVEVVAGAGFFIPESDVPLAVEVVFYRRRIKGHYRSGRFERILKPTAPAYPISPPDCTKLWRGFEDSLTGLLWHDDSRVVQQLVHEDFIPRWDEPSSALRLWRLPATVADLDPEKRESAAADEQETLLAAEGR